MKILHSKRGYSVLLDKFNESSYLFHFLNPFLLRGCVSRLVKHIGKNLGSKEYMDAYKTMGNIL